MKKLYLSRIDFFAIVIVLLLCNFVTLSAQNWDLKQKLGSSDQEPGDNLGISVAVSGSWMIAGAWWEEGEDGSNQPLTSAGAAYVYKMKPNGTWEETQKLISPYREVLGYYGFYVAMDGDYALVGAYNEDLTTAANAGRVYTYHRNANDRWILDDSLLIENSGNNDYFGINLAIAGDYALVGAPGNDYDDADANFLDGAGAAYLFKRNPNNSWVQLEKLVAFDRTENDQFGKHVDIDSRGLVIGAFHKNQDFSLFETGAAYAISCDGGNCDFENITSADLKKIKSPDQNSYEHFGWDVAISGSWVVCGKSSESDQPGGGSGSNTGAAYFFHWENGQWVGKQKVYAPDFGSYQQLGRAIAMDGQVCVIGAGGESEDANGQHTVSGAGAAYIFELKPNNQWMPVEKIVGTKRGIGDLFGEDAVAVNGTHVVVGAWLADTIAGPPRPDGGAVYIFERDSPLTAVQDYAKEMNVSILNNPSMDGTLQLQNMEESSVPITLKIFSMDGRPVYQEADLMNQEYQNDFSSLPPGIYLVQIHQEGYLPRTLKWIRL